MKRTSSRVPKAVHLLRAAALFIASPAAGQLHLSGNLASDVVAPPGEDIYIDGALFLGTSVTIEATGGSIFIDAPIHGYADSNCNGVLDRDEIHGADGQRGSGCGGVPTAGGHGKSSASLILKATGDILISSKGSIFLKGGDGGRGAEGGMACWTETCTVIANTRGSRGGDAGHGGTLYVYCGGDFLVGGTVDVSGGNGGESGPDGSFNGLPVQLVVGAPYEGGSAGYPGMVFIVCTSDYASSEFGVGRYAGILANGGSGGSGGAGGILAPHPYTRNGGNGAGGAPGGVIEVSYPKVTLNNLNTAGGVLDVSGGHGGSGGNGSSSVGAFCAICTNIIPNLEVPQQGAMGGKPGLPGSGGNGGEISITTDERNIIYGALHADGGYAGGPGQPGVSGTYTLGVSPCGEPACPDDFAGRPGATGVSGRSGGSGGYIVVNSGSITLASIGVISAVGANGGDGSRGGEGGFVMCGTCCFNCGSGANGGAGGSGGGGGAVALTYSNTFTQLGPIYVCGGNGGRGGNAGGGSPAGSPGSGGAAGATGTITFNGTPQSTNCSPSAGSGGSSGGRCP